MDKTYKAKEYLLEQGKIEAITRGRMSNANKEFLAQAAANGVKFSDFKGEASTNDNGETVVKNVAPKTSDINNIAEEFVRYAGPFGGISKANDVWAVKVNGKTLPTPDGHGGVKSICFNCGYSLVGHMCNNPAIIHDGEIVAVTIESR